MSTAAQRGQNTTRAWLAIALALLGILFAAAFLAPTQLPNASMPVKNFTPFQAPPFGNDDMGRPLLVYAMMGARVVALPSLIAGIIVSMMAIVAGLSRSANIGWTDTALQAASEVVGALPRLVVVLVVALIVPREYASLYPVAITWAILAAPGAMDEAAATAERLGGARFVEALRAHGFSAFRIYGYHITWLNLRSVVVRQGAEVMMQSVFLEIAMSYLAAARHRPAVTHGEDLHSWASLLYSGYSRAVMAHSIADRFGNAYAFWVGLAMLALVAFMTQAFRLSARAR